MSHSAARLLTLTRALSTEARAQKVERIANELLDLNRFERHDFTVLWRLKMGLHRYGAPVAAAPSGEPCFGFGAPPVSLWYHLEWKHEWKQWRKDYKICFLSSSLQRKSESEELLRHLLKVAALSLLSP